MDTLITDDAEVEGALVVPVDTEAEVVAVVVVVVVVAVVAAGG